MCDDYDPNVDYLYRETPRFRYNLEVVADTGGPQELIELTREEYEAVKDVIRSRRERAKRSKRKKRKAA